MEDGNEIKGALVSEFPHSIAAETPGEREFRADLNHKLRTPLNAIIGFAELLALQPGSKQKEGDVQQILKSAREMLAIIETELAGPKNLAREKGGSASKASSCDVLYVEDDLVNAILVKRILEFRPGLTMAHANQGRAGLSLALQAKPKMILLDLNLPDMHGSELLQTLQHNPATAAIPVVILSADATPSQIERLLAAGAKNYLTKPFDIEQFLTVIDEFVAASRT